MNLSFLKLKLLYKFKVITNIKSLINIFHTLHKSQMINIKNLYYPRDHICRSIKRINYDQFINKFNRNRVKI